MRRLLPIAAAALLAACSDDPLQRMWVQPKYVWYSANPLFKDARAMRVPPEGTVPRERLPVLSIDRARGPDGRYLTALPLQLTPELMTEGRKRYEIFCATCHGLLGDGDSQVARNMSLRPPPSLHPYRDRPLGYFYEIITKGFGVMPPYANEIPARERWAVVAYVRALQLSQHATLDQLPAGERQRLEATP